VESNALLFFAQGYKSGYSQPNIHSKGNRYNFIALRLFFVQQGL